MKDENDVMKKSWKKSDLLSILTSETFIRKNDWWAFFKRYEVTSVSKTDKVEI